MFKWLFQGKKIALEKANAKRLEEEEANRLDVTGARERVKYLFNHRTNANGQPFTFTDLEDATSSKNPVRQVTVTWLNDLVEDRLTDLKGKLGQLYAISAFFGVPSSFDFWFGDFTDELKTQIRVTDYFITCRWQKVYDTESVLLHASGLSTSFSEPQAKLYRDALDSFLSRSDFKSTLAANLLLWPEKSYLLIGITPHKTYNVFEEADLKEEPFNFSSEQFSELNYLLKEGWDFEWYSPSVEGDPTLYLSVSVPDGVVSNQVKQGGPYFVQQLLDDAVNLEWVTDHFHKRLDYMLGLRVPDTSITAHQNDVVALLCGRGSRTLTVGDVRKMTTSKEAGQPLSTYDKSMAELVKHVEERSNQKN